MGGDDNLCPLRSFPQEARQQTENSGCRLTSGFVEQSQSRQSGALQECREPHEAQHPFGNLVHVKRLGELLSRHVMASVPAATGGNQAV